MNNLKARRVELGLSQPQVSALLKKADPRMDVGMVSRFENGVCLPTPEVLVAVEAVLQAPAAELYDDAALAAIHQDKPCLEELPQATQATLDAVPFGRKNAIARKALCAKLGLPDRKVREHIEQARRAGHIIINEQTGRGYFRSDDLDDIEIQYRQDTSRAMSILARRKALRLALKDAGREV